MYKGSSPNYLTNSNSCQFSMDVLVKEFDRCLVSLMLDAANITGIAEGGFWNC